MQQHGPTGRLTNRDSHKVNGCLLNSQIHCIHEQSRQQRTRSEAQRNVDTGFLLLIPFNKKFAHASLSYIHIGNDDMANVATRNVQKKRNQRLSVKRNTETCSSTYQIQTPHQCALRTTESSPKHVFIVLNKSMLLHCTTSSIHAGKST